MLDALVRVGERFLLARFAEVEPFGIDELDVGDADERQEVANVGGLAVTRRSRVAAAARREDIGFLARQQAFGTVRGIAESDSGASDVVEIRFERRRNAEVVHRHAEYDGLRALEFVDQRVRLGDQRLLARGALGGSGDERQETFGIEVRQRLAGEIANDHLRAIVIGAPGGDELIGELARLAAGREQAGVDLQQGGGGIHGGGGHSSAPCWGVRLFNYLPDR